MARVIIKKKQEPQRIKIAGKDFWFCQCGLSAKFPFCDGSHRQTQDEDEGRLYLYQQGQRKEVRLVDAKKEGE